MRYEGAIYRPPSEAQSLILQATLGCSHNRCTYCAMYREKAFRVRALDEVLADIAEAGRRLGGHVRKVFVADGDALVMGMDHWMPILAACRAHLPNLHRVSCYATANNVLEKGDGELHTLRQAGLELLYLGPESGDPETLRRVVKGASADAHIEAAARAKRAGMEQSVIILLGAGGVERSAEHAEASAHLVTQMDPEYLSALTITVVPDTPLALLQARGRFTLPNVAALLGELRVLVDGARPRRALFRTNHASNYLPLAGTLPDDRARIVAIIDAALSGEVGLRPEWLRGL